MEFLAAFFLTVMTGLSLFLLVCWVIETRLNQFEEECLKLGSLTGIRPSIWEYMGIVPGHSIGNYKLTVQRFFKPKPITSPDHIARAAYQTIAPLAIKVAKIETAKRDCLENSEGIPAPKWQQHRVPVGLWTAQQPQQYAAAVKCLTTWGIEVPHDYSRFLVQEDKSAGTDDFLDQLIGSSERLMPFFAVTPESKYTVNKKPVEVWHSWRHDNGQAYNQSYSLGDGHIIVTQSSLRENRVYFLYAQSTTPEAHAGTATSGSQYYQTMADFFSDFVWPLDDGDRSMKKLVAAEVTVPPIDGKRSQKLAERVSVVL